MPGRIQPLRPRLPSSIPVREELPAEDEASWEAFEIVADLSRRTSEGLDIAECRFRGAQLTLVDFDRCRIRDSLFVDCQASGAALEQVSLSRVEFQRCRLTGAVLSRGRFRDVRFVECQMQEVQVRLAQGARVRFDSCEMADADFYGSTFDGVCYFDCDLTRSDFSQVSLRSARLHGSKLEALRGVFSLSGATVSSTQALPLAVQLLSAAGIEIDDEREPLP